MNHHLGECDAELQRLHRTVVAKLDELREQAVASAAASSPGGGFQSRDTFSRRVLDYFRLRLDHLAISAAEHTVHLLLSDAKAMSDEITALGREIDQIAAAVCRAAQADSAGAAGVAADASTRAVHAGVTAGLKAKLSELASEVDRQLQAEYISAHGGLLTMVMQGGRPRAQLSAKLHELSRQVVQRALARINVLDDAPDNKGSKQLDEIRSGLALATPSLMEFGGTRRVLAVLPHESTSPNYAAMLSRVIGSAPASIRGADNNLTLCVEADRLSIQHIAVSFVQRRRDRVDFAQRVHCRTDITWSPLVATSSTPASMVWTGTPAGQVNQTISRQDMCKTLVM
jgi:hypothetical protein